MVGYGRGYWIVTIKTSVFIEESPNTAPCNAGSKVAGNPRVQ